MENIEFALRGQYNTSFFSFFVNTQEDIFNEDEKFNHDLNSKDKGTFIHEYVHYIQNIATTYGLMDITKTYNLLGYIVNQVHNHETDEIELPVSLEISQSIIQNYYRFYLFRGNSEFKNLHKFNKLEPEYFEGEYEGIKQRCLRFNCFLDNTKIDSFVFGATCIKETMAHLIQCLIDPNIVHSDIPYKSAEIIVNYFYPELVDNDKLNIITLCYYSLYLPDSGNFFFEVLTRLKKLSYIPENSIEFYTYLHNDFSDCVTIEPEDDDTILWDKYWEEAQMQIKEYSGLQNAKNGSDTLIYLDEVFKSVKNIQEKLPSFFIGSISFLKKEQHEVIEKWLENYGTPHIYTENKDYLPKNGQGLIFLSPIHTVLYNLIGVSQKCNPHLITLCSKNGVVNDNYCYSAPWERINEGCVECPFTVLWKNLSLDKKKIILK